MHAQRRVSLPAPARTTRMNGGPRLRAPVPLPPYRPGVQRLHGERRAGPATAVSGSSAPWPSQASATEVVVEPRVDAAPAPDMPSREYAPPAIVAESPTFPMDAFIIPEGAARLPRGVEPDVTATPAPRTPELVDTAPLPVREEPRLPRGPALREQRAHDVASRLEALAAQLRNHGYEVLAQKSVRGDPLDALLAGVIAGYLVAAE